MQNFRQSIAFLSLAAILFLAFTGWLFFILYFAAWIFLIISAVILAFRLLFPYEVSERDVYEVLSPMIWQTAAEVTTIVKARKRIPEAVSLIEAVEAHLHNLEKRGGVERQVRTWDATRCASCDQREPEFRRKAFGDPRRVRPRFQIIRFAPQAI